MTARTAPHGGLLEEIGSGTPHAASGALRRAGALCMESGS